MRRLLRIILWMVKGLMLLIALGALVMWPVSRGRFMSPTLKRYELDHDAATWRSCSIGFWDGRAIVESTQGGTSNPTRVRLVAEEIGGNRARWRFTTVSTPFAWESSAYAHRWSVLRWGTELQTASDLTHRWREGAAPAWFVALVAGTWPCASLTLAVRRTRRRRRAAREGLCASCGYDLRATPRPPADGGEVLAVCPECGHASGARAPSHPQ